MTLQILEVFFDYICPYCIRSHRDLLALLPGFPHIRVEWRPCESHPRPERYGPHSDLCIQGMFYARDLGVDLPEYHERIYRAIHIDRVDVENIPALARCVDGLLDPISFRAALERGDYRAEQQQANRYAFERNGVWAVPAYRMNGRRLDSVEDVGVTPAQLEAFFRAATH